MFRLYNSHHQANVKHVAIYLTNNIVNIDNIVVL